VSLGNGSVAENGLEVLELTEQPSFYSHVWVWSAEGASLGSPHNRFYLDLAGQSVYSSSSMFCSAIPICKCSPNSTHYDVALLEHQLCTFLEKLSIRVVDWSAILPYACVMYVAGPKVALCAGPLIYALLKLQAEHHVKFTAIESSYIWR
jgi:hypothetical protein